ncbi:MAG: IS701 family transposase [Solirubrobacterales bacterium]|nr:IS701 family transposase [Solirubrobacterales bacterium]
MAVGEASSDVGVRVDRASSVRGRLEAFAVEVLAEATNRPVQVVNGGLYVRGLLEEGARKSLEPIVARLGGEADYQSMQQFLTDSPWDSGLVVRAVAERVAGEIDVQAWVLDDTGFRKDGKGSPGVKRQYSGSFQKFTNCQIGVSLHAVGSRGTVPLGWALYLPKEWCEDSVRRTQAKIPEQVEFQTKPQLGAGLAIGAAGWKVKRGPVLGDCAYGNNTEMREQLDEHGLSYLLAVTPELKMFEAATTFRPPLPSGGRYTARGRPVPDREPETIEALIAQAGGSARRTLTFRDGPDGRPRKSRFVFLRVRCGRDWNFHEHTWFRTGTEPPREEWLIAEWPKGGERPSGYWLSNLPASAKPGALARLARMRWSIELDYKQLKGELGLDHYEGRSWLGWYHHTALVTAAHGFLTLERLRPP